MLLRWPSRNTGAELINASLLTPSWVVNRLLSCRRSTIIAVGKRWCSQNRFAPRKSCFGYALYRGFLATTRQRFDDELGVGRIIGNQQNALFQFTAHILASSSAVAD